MATKKHPNRKKSPSLSHIRRAKRYYRSRFHEDPSVVGLGIGEKLVGGKPTDQLALRVYVKKKLPLDKVRAEHRLPTQVPVPGPRGVGMRNDLSIPVDVIEMGVLKPRSGHRPRPLQMGFGCSRVSAQLFDFGTMGAIVEDQRGRRYLIGNNHVLADVNRGRPGDRIIQPAIRFGGRPNQDQIGILDRFVPIRRGGINRVDAALVRLLPGLGANGNRIRGVPFPVTQLAVPIPPRNTRVFFMGGTSAERVEGRIFDREHDGARVATVRAEFDDQIVIRGRSQGGDSGALVVTRTGRAIGLVMAGRRDFTIVCPIKTVLDELGSALLSTGRTDLRLRLAAN